MDKKILLVDDDREFLRSLAEVLGASGMGDVTCAHDGQEACEILSQQEMDLVITDINMPRLSGVGLLAYMRKEQIKTPAIVITGVSQKLETVSEYDVKATLLKPFKFIALMKEIQRIFISNGEST